MYSYIIYDIIIACRSWNSLNRIYVIPEQFTVKAHPALFDGEPKKVALIFQFTIHIHIQNYYSRLQFTYTFKTYKQTAKAHTLCVYLIRKL